MAADRDRLAAMADVADDFKHWRPQSEVIKNVESVPTRFIQYDEMTGVAGQPISRITLIHGPSNEGKTEFCIGLGSSFLAAGHFFGLADAERTTTSKWISDLTGSLRDHPGFVALPVKSYEQVRDGVRSFCDRIADARTKGKLPEDITGLIVVDSIRKLVPESLWKNLSKEIAGGKKGKDGKNHGIDGFSGRAGQIKAALNAAWVDELVPLLADTRTAIAIIARETKDGDAGFFDSRDWKVGGGSALYYDSSVDLRVLKKTLYVEKEMVGEKHKIEMWKTKVGKKTRRVPYCHFHTSLALNGFDRGRDVFELAKDLDVIKVKGSHYYYGRKRLGQGEEKVVALLNETPDFLATVEAEVRESFREAADLPDTKDDDEVYEEEED